MVLAGKALSAAVVAALAMVATVVSADDKPVPVTTPAPGTPRTSANFGVAVQPPFEQQTVRLGKPVETDLKGVWLLVAYAQVAPDKYKTFPQLLKITAAEKGFEIRLIDARLPADAEQELREASMRTLTKWVPSPELLQSLGAGWQQLAPAAEKTLDEYLFAKIVYTLSTPDGYAQAFPRRDPPLEALLAGSPWVLSVAETFRPRDLPADARVAQLMERTTIYGAKQIAADRISGDIVIGFVAAGAGTPLPFNFQGDFAMYRLSPP
jgi:hypothetical protein